MESRRSFHPQIEVRSEKASTAAQLGQRVSNLATMEEICVILYSAYLGDILFSPIAVSAFLCLLVAARSRSLGPSGTAVYSIRWYFGVTAAQLVCKRLNRGPLVPEHEQHTLQAPVGCSFLYMCPGNLAYYFQNSPLNKSLQTHGIASNEQDDDFGYRDLRYSLLKLYKASQGKISSKSTPSRCPQFPLFFGSKHS
ncbi:hypothetical protein KL930_001691 [Ogataea haglerorum]|uniref:Uncharacterized protein n=1 Tax=Ogataea haglerorum TaxID=1937702 RepID=A0ABQ7RKP0_9ASCO|nr:hypothetical protein KL914_001977 [Ogataea haglerorum]KAG7732678.1 hypothetical protein KL948_002108 [Ogataea haglerorum]KAG7740127.1 hypothetical protein KL923_001968 [Ogataea haglerorum]KAG7760257.1 hypothetical protein KL947_001101 [Ogataea haglerorum]KAG7767424.1 hypothetical protein KL946_001523 [Ogataea haglerorum]